MVRLPYLGKHNFPWRWLLVPAEARSVNEAAHLLPPFSFFHLLYRLAVTFACILFEDVLHDYPIGLVAPKRHGNILCSFLVVPKISGKNIQSLAVTHANWTYILINFMLFDFISVFFSPFFHCHSSISLNVISPISSVEAMSII